MTWRHQAHQRLEVVAPGRAARRAASRRHRLADRLDDVRRDQRPAIHQRRVRGRELDRRDRHALAERAVREVDLLPRLDGRVVDEAAHLAGDVDAGRLGRSPSSSQMSWRIAEDLAVVSPRPRATFAATTLRE